MDESFLGPRTGIQQQLAPQVERKACPIGEFGIAFCFDQGIKSNVHARSAIVDGSDWKTAVDKAVCRVNQDAPEQPVSVALLFLTVNFKDNYEEILEQVRFETRAVHLIGCSAVGLIGNGQELEGRSGISLMTLRLPNTSLTTCHFDLQTLEEEHPPEFWRHKIGVAPDQVSGWLLFGDPFNTPCDRLVTELGAAYPNKPIIGGLASTPFTDEPESFLFLDNKIVQNGAVGIAIGTGTRIDTIISQGCTPIGTPHTITKADQNIIFEIGSQPAYDVLVDTVKKLDSDLQSRARGNLFVGLVMNEYLEEYKRGDFLIRNILGANPEQGFLAVGALPKAGQTLQFQLRDRAAAHEEMVTLLETVHRKMGKTRPFAALVCSCNGRGIGLFQLPNHDAEQVGKIFDPVEVAGFFCSGEIGPVGDKNFLHGYTSAIALFSPGEKE